MFQKSSTAGFETLTIDQPKAATLSTTLWGFRRRAPRDQTAPPARAGAGAGTEDAAFIPDAAPYGAESFGRGGLELGGLHRDQQWVGAWGGRC